MNFVVLPFWPGKVASAGFTAFSSAPPLASSSARVIEANTRMAVLISSTFLLWRREKGVRPAPPKRYFYCNVAWMKLERICQVDILCSAR